MNNQNLKTAKLIKAILVKLAIDDKLPMDMHWLDESIFLPAFIVDEKQTSKVYVINADELEKCPFYQMSEEEIIIHCEETGKVYSLEGFEAAINKGDLSVENSFIKFI